MRTGVHDTYPLQRTPKTPPKIENRQATDPKKLGIGGIGENKAGVRPLKAGKLIPVTLTEPKFHTRARQATPRVGPGESKLLTRPLPRHASECFGSAGVAGRSCHPSLSLRGERPHVAHELLPSSRQSTGCATHLAHVNVCGLSLSPSLTSLLLPSAALPSLASAPPYILAYVLPSRSHVPRSLWPVSWQATEVHITETRVRCSRCNAELALAPYAPLAPVP